MFTLLIVFSKFLILKINNWTETIFNGGAIGILLKPQLQDNSSMCKSALHIAGCLKSLASDQ